MANVAGEQTKTTFMSKLLFFAAIFIFFQGSGYAQTRTITGRISDSLGSPIPGASVKIKGERRGISATTEGTFVLKTEQNATLIVSAIGYITQEVPVENSSSVSIQLHAGNGSVLNEVIVTSLGVKREKRALTYSAQEVKGDVLLAAKQDNIVNGLQGKIAGVQITNSTGMPGSSARIVIRGATSLIGENQPLFVVDGVPIDNTEAGPIDAFGAGPNANGTAMGSTSNRGIDIDPNIIETVTVLKGAAATAIYGSSAATGAVIITTKNGIKSSKPQVSFSSSYGLAVPIYYPFQNKYAQGIDGQFIDGNGPDKTSSSWGPAVDTLKVNGAPVKTYNQQKLFFQTGRTSDNNINVSGATDHSRYLLSYSYLNTQGISPTTDFIRNTVFGKFTNQVTPTLLANFQMDYINSANHRLPEGQNIGNPLWTVYSAPITWNPMPATEADGTQRLYRSLARNNPYYALANLGFVSNVNRFLPVISLVFTPANWITVTDRIGADIYSDESGYHESSGIISGYFNNNGGVTNRNILYRQFNNDLIVDLHKQLSDDFFGSVLLGTNLLSRYNDTYIQTGQGQSVAGFYNISNFTTLSSSDYLSRYRKTGYYLQANLEYRKFLYLALTGRYDGSSVLPVTSNYYPYGSAAMGFVFTELMHPGTGALSFGKVRISYSSVGNDDVLPYSLTTPFIQAVGSANNIIYPFNGQNAFIISSQLGNGGLKNESLKEFETGLELKFFNNRLSFDGSYFDRRTTDLLTPVSVAPSSGYFSYVLNAGSIQNKGFELLLSGAAVHHKNFEWDVNLNFSKINSNVLALAPGVNSIQLAGLSGAGTYAFLGKPYGVLYGSGYLRNAQGQLVLGDVGSGNDGLPIAGPDKILGDINPDFLMGLTNSFTYKSFNISFLFDWKQHGATINVDNYYNLFYGTTKSTENRVDRIIPGVYQTSGKPSTTVVTAQDYFKEISTIVESQVEDATYIKLRNVNISYTLTPSAFKKSYFKSLTLTLSGTNLWIYKPHFSGADPEASLEGSAFPGTVNVMTPTSRNFILGFRLNF